MNAHLNSIHFLEIEEKGIHFLSSLFGIYLCWLPGKHFSFSRKTTEKLSSNFYINIFGIELGKFPSEYWHQIYFKFYKGSDWDFLNTYFFNCLEINTPGFYIWGFGIYFLIGIDELFQQRLRDFWTQKKFPKFGCRLNR